MKFLNIINTKAIVIKSSFGGDRSGCIVEVQAEISTPDTDICTVENRTYIITDYGSYVHEWPLGPIVTGAEADELKLLLRAYDIHKAACELGAI